jgi:hypothetical protein
LHYRAELMFSNNEEKAAGPYWYWRQQPTGPDTNFSSRTSCYIQKVSNHEGTMAALFTILVIGDVVQDEVPQLALANRLPLGPVVFSRTFFFFFATKNFHQGRRSEPVWTETTAIKRVLSCLIGSGHDFY